MICVHCGKEIDNGQDFCPYCGGHVGSDAATEAKAAKKDPPQTCPAGGCRGFAGSRRCGPCQPQTVYRPAALRDDHGVGV